MATMQKAPVDDTGTTLALIDSGPPASDSYATIVFVHGLSYNSQIFTRILPLASSHSLRIIALNRRDYTNSTPLSHAELAQLFSKDSADHKRFLHARGLEIARFLEWVIDELKVPPLRGTSGTAGGLTLLGWSLGSLTTLAFLRHLPSFPNELISKLEPYLKNFIIYDSGYTTLGYPHPPGAYHPFRDPEIPVQDHDKAFVAWISSYFTHPYYSLPSDSQESRTLEQLALPTPVLGSTPADAATFKAASYMNIEPEAFAAAIDVHPYEKAFYGIVQPETIYDQLSGSLFFTSKVSSDPSANANDIPLPELHVIYLYGTHSPWSTQWSAWSLESDIAAHIGDKRRPVDLVIVEGVNHFWHWDDPDGFLTLLAEKSGSQKPS
ncbi:alpha/beta-hydrolase [Fomitiporia mediterranea MF3/22]|uniref:alpha/beta-hydrolase n=1 Tax=Fomitiporia mediterranea (strain MF3/22) TaxID=694068 RepID=UPI0004409976|nr:alpha/beta-hydrolase [Fomitiporia mediterranea MF3/22]EJD08472.1 alpha/beta-hydrolase [Fomitiporia mediterranea MF3/22]